MAGNYEWSPKSHNLDTCYLIAVIVVCYFWLNTSFFLLACSEHTERFYHDFSSALFWWRCVPIKFAHQKVSGVVMQVITGQILEPKLFKLFQLHLFQGTLVLNKNNVNYTLTVTQYNLIYITISDDQIQFMHWINLNYSLILTWKEVGMKLYWIVIFLQYVEYSYNYKAGELNWIGSFHLNLL